MMCFVSGAGGAIGLPLCKALRARGDVVIAGQRHVCEGPWDRFIEFDLAGAAITSQDLQGVECIFHLAGKAHAHHELDQNTNSYFEINTEGTRKLLEASKTAGVKRFVYFSSVKAFGEGGDLILDETDDCAPETAYGTSKLKAERFVLEGGYVPEPLVLRLSMVYGTGRTGNLPKMIEAVAKGYFPPLPEVHNRRSMVHVDDVIQAAILAGTEAAAIGQTYIVSDGRTYSTREIFECICEALGRPVPRWTTPMAVLKVLAELGDVIGRVRGKRFVFDSEGLDRLAGSACYSSGKIVRELGFCAQHDLRSTLPEIITSLGIK